MKAILLIISMAMMTLIVHAQVDSFNVNESKWKKTYNYLTMAKKAEKSIWKLKILPLQLSDLHSDYITYENVPIIFAYEHKITPSLSYQIESKNMFYKVGETRTQIPYIGYGDSNHTNWFYQGVSSSKQLIFNSSMSAELRYYYFMKRRMHRRHASNNFSADYVALKATKNVVQTGVDYFDALYNMENPFPDRNSLPFYDNTISVYYGIQRRFLKYFFADIHGGVAYRYGSESIRPYSTTWSLNEDKILTPSTNYAPRIVGVFTFRIGFAF